MRSATHSIEAGELVVEPALELRRSGAVASLGAARRARLQRHGEHAEDARRRPSAATGGSTHASRSKPRFGGAASTCSPNWATSVSLISGFVSPAAMRARMNVRMRSATGDVDWSSVVWHVGQTTSPSSSASVGC